MNTDILGSLSTHQLQQLEIYYQMLAQTNDKYNLTAIVDREQVYVKHFVDSMMGADLLPCDCRLVDVGSGAGFPGIPLKVCRNDIQLTLVDSLNKRVNFTKEVAEAIGIDIKCEHSRAEDFVKNNREKFDVATARAVAPLNILLEYTAALVRVGGFVLAYKTDVHETESCSNAMQVLGLRLGGSKIFQLPNGDNRALLIFDKVKSTPAKYPRGGNNARKSPL